MNKIKIGKRIIICVLLYLTLSGSIGAFLVLQMYRITTVAEKSFHERVIPLGQIDTMVENFSKTRLNFRTLFITVSDKKIYEQLFNKNLTLYESNKASTLKGLTDYIDMVNARSDASQEGKDIANATLDSVKAYFDFSDKAVSLIKSGNIDQAKAVLISADTQKAGALAEENVQALFDYNLNMATALEKQNTDTAHSTILWSSILIVLALALLGVLFARLARSITKPLAQLKHILTEVANGNFDVEASSNGRDEIADLTRDTRKVIDSIQRLTKDMSMMADGFQKGDIGARIDTSQYKGSYQLVANGVNKMTGDIISEVVMFLDCLNEFGKGNFKSDIPRLPGKKAVMNESLDRFRDNLQTINKDIVFLVNEAIQGNLSNRADADQYEGDWATILVSLNKLLEAISAPVQEVSIVMGELSVGNFDTIMKGDYQGEFLSIKNSVNNTVAHMASYIEEITRVLTGIADDNLDQDINKEYVGKFHQIKKALNKIIKRLNNVVLEISEAADTVALSATHVSSNSAGLAQGASEQLSSVEQLNETFAIIRESTEKTSRSAKEAEQLSSNSKENAIIGNENMRDMLTSMEDIKVSSNNISKIIKVIEDIAFQTNLLALNAAVEAARAGAHGKGFAVVAEEVRSLATRSQTAATETTSLIQDSILKVNNGSKIAELTSTALRTIVQDTTQVSDIISNISAISKTQTDSIRNVSDGLEQIAQVVQRNSATSEEAAAASEELAGQSDTLKQIMGLFTVKANRR